LVIYGVPLAWQIFFPWLGTKEGALISLISRLENSQPITSTKLLPGLPCKADKRFPDGCNSTNIRWGRINIAEVDLSPQTRGSIISLNGFGPGCFDQDLIFKKYPGGQIENACDHSYCPYYRVNRSWGTLSFELPTSDEPRTCVKGAVLRSGVYE
jgi:hypothetical protein